MRIDRLTVAIRPRKHWEAADLGVRLLRDSQAEVLRLWCCLMAPLLAALVWLEHSTGRLIGLYVLWWLKPLLDYAVLWVLSRAVFGEKVTLGASLAAIPGFFNKGLLGALTLRRFSLSRAYVLPVRLLEDLKSPALDERIRLMRHHQTGRARWLIQICMAAEMAVFFSLLSMLVWMTPALQDIKVVSDFLEAQAGDWKRDVLVLIYGLTITLVEPFYVAAGFMLYLNRRTDLEAWDIEIAFRRLAERISPAGRD